MIRTDYTPSSIVPSSVLIPHSILAILVLLLPILCFTIQMMCPVLMGPILIYKQKKNLNHIVLASSLVGLKPSLHSLSIFGTDDEKAISNAMHVVLEKAVHLRCFFHSKGNLDMKLREYGVPKNTIEFLRDIFYRFGQHWCMRFESKKCSNQEICIIIV